jgi:hypothetical protein
MAEVDHRIFLIEAELFPQRNLLMRCGRGAGKPPRRESSRRMPSCLTGALARTKIATKRAKKSDLGSLRPAVSGAVAGHPAAAAVRSEDELTAQLERSCIPRAVDLAEVARTVSRAHPVELAVVERVKRLEPQIDISGRFARPWISTIAA